MAKGKTTLSDLNKFLSQEPNQLSKIEKIDDDSAPLSLDTLAAAVALYAAQQGISVRDGLYACITKVLEKADDPSPADIVLGNMAIFLSHQESRIKDLESKLAK